MIINGQTVINLEPILEEGCVLVELGPAPQAGGIVAKLYKDSSLVEISPEAGLGMAAGLHLAYFRVALNEKNEMTSYEAGVVIPPDVEVALRGNNSGDREVCGRVFKNGEMDLAVGLGKDGKLVKTAIFTNGDYVDVELKDTELLKQEALSWAGKIGSLVDGEMQSLDLSVLADVMRHTPEIAAMLAELEKGAPHSDVM